jgi:hypothetical protein
MPVARSDRNQRFSKTKTKSKQTKPMKSKYNFAFLMAAGARFENTTVDVPADSYD